MEMRNKLAYVYYIHKRSSFQQDSLASRRLESGQTPPAVPSAAEQREAWLHLSSIVLMIPTDERAGAVGIRTRRTVFVHAVLPITADGKAEVNILEIFVQVGLPKRFPLLCHVKCEWDEVSPRAGVRRSESERCLYGLPILHRKNSGPLHLWRLLLHVEQTPDTTHDGRRVYCAQRKPRTSLISPPAGLKSISKHELRCYYLFIPRATAYFRLSTTMTTPLNQAEQLKAEGNALFLQNDFVSAYQKYTEAISYDSKNAILYCNRAACAASEGMATYVPFLNKAPSSPMSPDLAA